VTAAVLEHRPLILGVAGGSGSGKSTVVKELVRILGPERTQVIHHDSYYRDLAHVPFPERVATNFDHPDSLETALIVDHVTMLRRGQAVEIPSYDFPTHTRAATTRVVSPAPVLVLDGILVLQDHRLRSLMDLKVYVHTDHETRLQRRIARDVAERGRTPESVRAQFETSVLPMHLEFVEPCRAHADIVIEEGGYNEDGILLVVERTRKLLARLRDASAGSGLSAPAR